MRHRYRPLPATPAIKEPQYPKRRKRSRQKTHSTSNQINWISSCRCLAASYKKKNTPAGVFFFLSFVWSVLLQFALKYLFKLFKLGPYYKLAIALAGIIVVKILMFFFCRIKYGEPLQRSNDGVCKCTTFIQFFFILFCLGPLLLSPSGAPLVEGFSGWTGHLTASHLHSA